MKYYVVEQEYDGISCGIHETDLLSEALDMADFYVRNRLSDNTIVKLWLVDFNYGCRILVEDYDDDMAAYFNFVNKTYNSAIVVKEW
jgi:hypothetical protein